MSMIGRRIGNYEIKAKIGEGGMGTVYLGEHPLIGKRVAVKVLLEELVAKEDVVVRFFNEAKAVNDIGHINIVDIVDFGRAPGDAGEEIVYFIMEYLDGEALSTRIRRAGLTFKETLHIIGQCCSALAASHQKGIVHRDLKPENIFVLVRGGDKSFVKILDFGIAKLTGDAGSVSHKTRTGLVIGTPTYMSPEQCEGKGHIDHRSDVYSLGIVLYELLTGVVPFPGEGFGEVLVAHLTKQPTKPSLVNPNVPPELEAIVLHAIEKDRNRRFQNMNEFLRAIEDPAAHYRSWHALPDYASAPTMTGVDPRQALQQRSGHTLSLDDVGHAAPPSVGGAPRPTTLEGAAAEVTREPRPRPKSRAPLYAALAALGAVAIGGGVVGVSKLAGHGDETTPAAVPVPDKPRAPAPADSEVSVMVVSEPSGARVVRADQPAEVQRTPVTYRLKKGDPAFDIQLRLDGYQPELRTITSDESVKMVVALAKLPTLAPRPATPTTAPTATGGTAARATSDTATPTTKPAKVTPVKVSKPGKPRPSRPASPPKAKPEDDDMNIMAPNFGN